MDVGAQPSLESYFWAGTRSHEHGAVDFLGCGLDSNFSSSILASVAHDHRVGVCIKWVHPSLETCADFCDCLYNCVGLHVIHSLVSASTRKLCN